MRTCAEWAVALASVLSHDADAVGGRLPDFGTGIAQGLQHALDKVLGVHERGRAAVLHDVVENAQTPLSVGPWPVGTLKPKRWVSGGGGAGSAAERTGECLLSAGRLVAAGARTKAAPSACGC